MARHYGKGYGSLVTSGSAAIEIALLHCGLERGSSVLIPDNCCHEVPAAILRAGGIPTVVPVGRGLVLTPELVRGAIPAGIRAVLAIHQYGLPCDVGGIRSVIGREVAIIEDAAQAWALFSRGHPVGHASDVLVTSFNEGKPLSIGEGGGVFADDPGIENHIDSWSPGQRRRPRAPLPYALSRYALPHLMDAVARAEALVARRRRIVSELIPRLRDHGLHPWHPAEGDAPSWHFLPVWMDSEELYARCTEPPCAEVLDIRKPHPLGLAALPMLAGRISALPAGERQSPARIILLKPEWVSEHAKSLDEWLCHMAA